jgi:demethylmenaquinone methyltransferase/2-methoxy-6-polyprenyl-1,4-benzoquinol methylase
MSLVDDVTQYYAARAPAYDETAGYTDSEAEQLRAPIKARYREMFAGHTVLEIACGTGYWTPAIAEVADSVLAVDINPSLLSQAEERCKHLPNVRFQVADAYTLEGVPNGFTAALGIWWWSHMPLERVPAFLATLHSRLLPGAFVLFVDQLPYDGFVRRIDPGGNTLEKRFLSDGRSFEIVKNFPTAENIHNALAGIADNVQYLERPDEKHWNVTYHAKK